MVMGSIYHAALVASAPEHCHCRASVNAIFLAERYRRSKPLNHGSCHGRRNSYLSLASATISAILIHDPATKATAAIDAPEAGPIIAALEREGWTLTDILVTHHHDDHVGGIAELKQKYSCRVVAPHDKAAEIADVDLRVARRRRDQGRQPAGARARNAGPHARTTSPTCSTTTRRLFAADTLFSIGCGRVFEGTYPMMWDSLLKLRALPDDMRALLRP